MTENLWTLNIPLTGSVSPRSTALVGANITPDLCVDDAMDERVAGDRGRLSGVSPGKETQRCRLGWLVLASAVRWAWGNAHGADHF